MQYNIDVCNQVDLTKRETPLPQYSPWFTLDHNKLISLFVHLHGNHSNKIHDYFLYSQGPQNITMGCWELNPKFVSPCRAFQAHDYIFQGHTKQELNIE